MSVYRQTIAARAKDGKPGPGPGVLRCDTPGHGEVTGDWASAYLKGWDIPGLDETGGVIPGLHPAGLRLCPACVARIMAETQNAVAAAAGRCAGLGVPPAGGPGQYIAVPVPRWFAATPPSEPAVAGLYGVTADTTALNALFRACDEAYPAGGRQAPAPLPEPQEADPQLTLTELPGEITGPGDRTGEHMTTFLNLAGGDTDFFEAAGGDAA